MQEATFLRSALQPNIDSSSLALPSDHQLDQRNREQLKSARVQEQVRLRMMQKGQGTIRQNGAAHQTAESSSSRYQYSSTMPNSYSSRSHVLSTQQKASTYRPSSYGTGKVGNFSSRSAMDVGLNRQISKVSQPKMQTQQSKQGFSTMTYTGSTSTRPTSFHERAYGNRRELDTLSLRSLRLGDGPRPSVAAEDRYSTVSEQVAEPNYYRGPSYGGGGGGSTYGTSYAVEKQVGSSYGNQMQRANSGTMTRDGDGGIAWVKQGEVQQNRTIRAPAMRTLQRFQSTNRTRTASSMYGPVQQQQVVGVGSSFGGMEQSSRAHSMHSLAESNQPLQELRGMDEYDGGNKSLIIQQSYSSGFEDMDLPSAVKYLMATDPNLVVLGAAYIQHKCYSGDDAKKQARSMQAIPKLVKLFNNSNQEVQRHATGAMRNLIYDNNENKKALVEENGIYALMVALKEPDDELRKNATGILWNLSSSDDLKDRLAQDTLVPLTDRILTPLSGVGAQAVIQQNASESEIFYNATGFLRNLSSASDKTRQKMRECPGLVDAMVSYTTRSLEVGKAEDKSVENSVCVLRNLSFRLYDEMPPSALQRLEGQRKNMANASTSEVVGCFTPQSKKLKEQQINADMATFAEVSKDPKGMEWLWNPQILTLYNHILQKCELNKHTTEAAAGALQNITAGDRRWASVLSRVALEQERILNPVLDRVRTADDHQLRSLTGLIRNLSRNARNKDNMSTKVVSHLVEKLPGSNADRSLPSDVLVNIIAVLNNLTVESPIAVRDIIYFDGLRKLMYLKNKRDGSENEKTARAASSLLANMWQYSKLHRDFKAKGFRKEDFLNS